MPNPKFTFKQEYQRIWHTSKSPLALGQVDLDPEPIENGQRWGVSAILRLTQPVANQLVNVAQDLVQYTGSNQILYSPTTIHTTIKTLDFFRSHNTPNDERISEYVKIVTQIAADHQPIHIAYKGLNATKLGVMAQGWPSAETIYAIRHQLDQELNRVGLIGPETGYIRQTAHSSVMVFTHQLLDPRGLVEYIESHRETNYGACEMQTIDIVQYQRSDNSVSFNVLAAIPLHL